MLVAISTLETILIATVSIYSFPSHQIRAILSPFSCPFLIRVIGKQYWYPPPIPDRELQERYNWVSVTKVRK